MQNKVIVFKIMHITKFRPISVPLVASWERSGSPLQQENATVMMRSDSYLPVPKEEKNPDRDLVGTKARNNESIVRDCIPNSMRLLLVKAVAEMKCCQIVNRNIT